MSVCVCVSSRNTLLSINQLVSPVGSLMALGRGCVKCVYLCIAWNVQKPPLFFAVKILGLLRAGVNQDACFLVYASW